MREGGRESRGNKKKEETECMKLDSKLYKASREKKGEETER